jgi:hypothetical protein
MDKIIRSDRGQIEGILREPLRHEPLTGTLTLEASAPIRHEPLKLETEPLTLTLTIRHEVAQAPPAAAAAPAVPASGAYTSEEVQEYGRALLTQTPVLIQHAEDLPNLAAFVQGLRAAAARAAGGTLPSPEAIAALLAGAAYLVENLAFAYDQSQETITGMLQRLSAGLCVFGRSVQFVDGPPPDGTGRPTMPRPWPPGLTPGP